MVVKFLRISILTILLSGLWMMVPGRAVQASALEQHSGETSMQAQKAGMLETYAGAHAENTLHRSNGEAADPCCEEGIAEPCCCEEGMPNDPETAVPCDCMAEGSQPSGTS